MSSSVGYEMGLEEVHRHQDSVVSVAVIGAPRRARICHAVIEWNLSLGCCKGPMLTPWSWTSIPYV
jgi:hypothetical protein